MDRIILFSVCIAVRIIVAYVAYLATTPYLRYMGYIAILPILDHLYLFFNDTRKKGFFEGKLWWNPVRPIHVVLYILFAYNAIQGNQQAWIYLLLDVIVGLLAFMHNELKTTTLVHNNI
jgi:hypothetical protein